MKLGIFKKTAAILTIVCLSITLFTACRAQIGENGSNTAGTEAPGNSSTAEATVPLDNVNQDPLGRYDPELEISFIRGIDDDLISNILPKCPGETIEDNRWTELIRDTLGIQVKYNWTVKGNEISDAFVQKLNVTLASGDLPDVIMVNPSQLKQLVDSDLIWDMTQYYNDYASDTLKEWMRLEGDGSIQSVTFQGKMMAVPEPVSMNESTQYLWIRNDWLKKLGLNPPKTMEDVLKISEAFTIRDPDGNGKADTYGLPVTKDLYNGCLGTEGFFAGYHAYPNMWIEDSSGKLVWGSTLPEVKTALQKLAVMFKSGQIDKEFGVKDSGKVAEWIAAGKYGMEYGHQWNPMYPLISNYNNDKDADWTGYQIVSADSRKVMVPLKFNQTRIFAVNKEYAHPEALVKLFNLYIEKIWGETGDFNKYFMPRENGNVGVWKFSPVYPGNPCNNFNIFKALQDARKKNDFSGLTGDPKSIQANLEAYAAGDTTQWGWEKIYGINGTFINMEQYKANGQFLPEKFVGAPTKTMATKKTSLDQMEKEEFIKIIMGAAPLEEFDKFVSDWNKSGGADITREVNEWYINLRQ